MRIRSDDEVAELLRHFPSSSKSEPQNQLNSFLICWRLFSILKRFMRERKSKIRRNFSQREPRKHQKPGEKITLPRKSPPDSPKIEASSWNRDQTDAGRPSPPADIRLSASACNSSRADSPPGEHRSSRRKHRSGGIRLDPHGRWTFCRQDFQS